MKISEILLCHNRTGVGTLAFFNRTLRINWWNCVRHQQPVNQNQHYVVWLHPNRCCTGRTTLCGVVTPQTTVVQAEQHCVVWLHPNPLLYRHNPKPLLYRQNNIVWCGYTPTHCCTDTTPNHCSTGRTTLCGVVTPQPTVVQAQPQTTVVQAEQHCVVWLHPNPLLYRHNPKPL